MPRPCKRRRICALPACGRFGPKGVPSGRERIVMSLDEYECIRLIDREGMTQEECSAQMDIARTTAQAIYNSARRKLAACLVDGCELVIQGGEYTLCDGSAEGCGCSRHCPRRGKATTNTGDEET